MPNAELTKPTYVNPLLNDSINLRSSFASRFMNDSYIYQPAEPNNAQDYPEETLKEDPNNPDKASNKSLASMPEPDTSTLTVPNKNSSSTPMIETQQEALLEIQNEKLDAPEQDPRIDNQNVPQMGDAPQIPSNNQQYR